MTDFSEQKRDGDDRAAELALGLLSGAERAEAERELLRNPAFRASYALWTAKTDQWLEDVPPANGGRDLWSSIEATIDCVDLGAAVDTQSRPAPRGPVLVWAVAATLSAVLAGITAIYFYQREAAGRLNSASLEQRLAQAEGERQVAQITGETSRVLVSALYDPLTGKIDLRLDLPAEPNLVPELWVIPDDGKPRSLGTFTTATVQLSVDDAIRPYLADGATLAVTMEPADDAPHDGPTGPVLGATQLTAI